MKSIELIGASIYWCEGSKFRIRKGKSNQKIYEVIVTNSNPNIIRIFLKFLRTLRIDEKRVRLQLHLYPEHNIRKEKLFWSKITGMPLTQFHKIQMKRGKGKNKKSVHGICQLRYASKDTYLKIENMINQIANM